MIDRSIAEKIGLLDIRYYYDVKRARQRVGHTSQAISRMCIDETDSDSTESNELIPNLL